MYRSFFFAAFHEQDTAAIKSYLYENIIIQTVHESEDGNHLKGESVQQFLKGLTLIPEHIKFKEELDAFSIHNEGQLAQVWTSYCFYVNEELRHRGVNAFTLVNTDGNWKIIHLVDTRYKE